MTERCFSPLHPAFWLATWFGSGKLGFAPGTCGSIAALPFAYAIQVSLGSQVLLAASALIFFIGWAAAAVYMRRTGQQGDPKEIVIDEVAGQWLLLSAFEPGWEGYLIALALFRVFDILKPWPVSLADRRIKGAFGVMFDDILAALIPFSAIQVIQVL